LTGYRKLKTNGVTALEEFFGVPDFSALNDFNQHQFSQEFQFLGQLPDKQIRYVLGLYYFNESGHSFYRLNYPTFGFATAQDMDVESTSKAVFGQVTWAPAMLDERLELTVGGRFTKDHKAATRSSGNNFDPVIEDAVPSNLGYSRFNPAFTVNYRWSDDISTYAKISTAYKAGASNPTAPVGRFDITWGPEKVTAYEVGVKSDWFDRRALLNIAAFETKFKDELFSVQSDLNQPGTAEAFNVGKKTITGVEVELTVAPVKDVVLGLNYSYLHAKLDEFRAAAGTIFDPAVNPFSPYKVGDDIRNVFLPLSGIGDGVGSSFDASGDYTFLYFGNGSLSAHLDYRWRDKYQSEAPAFPGANQFAVAPSYGVLNGNLTMDMGLADNHRMKISAWAKNIFDYDKSTNVDGSGFVNIPIPLSADPVVGFSNSTYRAWVEPRSYGITLAFQF